MPREDVPIPPVEPPFREKDLKDIQDQKDLQIQARFNTNAARDLAYKLEAITERINTFEVDSADPVQTQQQQSLREEKDQLSNLLLKRRVRSSALIRRRKEMESVVQKQKEAAEERENQELNTRLRLGDLSERKKQLEQELFRLADEAQKAQFKATGAENRELARRLLALSRGCFAAHEAIKRVPPLVERDLG